jgi:hypothetical protein
MPDTVVWVQAETLAGSVRTWHLGGALGDTLCGQSTRTMKSLPKAVWDQVLNPCSRCQLKKDLPAVASEPLSEPAEDRVVTEVEHEPIGRHARRKSA